MLTESSALSCGPWATILGVALHRFRLCWRGFHEDLTSSDSDALSAVWRKCGNIAFGKENSAMRDCKLPDISSEITDS
jgi:hypothetical protein